ncbi:MAG: type II toxin-antitoxin system VapC family toxin [Spirochaetes bacterium]|nr:type II toxin-antitoxin system VapC family toxin [Spirochaetota bacterium]
METSFFSYLTANISNNLVSAARQQITNEWWQNNFDKYKLFISDFVIAEASKGDAKAAEKRIKFIKENQFKMLEITDDCVSLAENLFKSINLPEKARDDALHISIAIYHNIDFLMTWNCRHIANAHFMKAVGIYCSNNKLSTPQICTPEEMNEE